MAAPNNPLTVTDARGVQGTVTDTAGLHDFSAVPPPTQEAVVGTAGSFAWGANGPPDGRLRTVDAFLNAPAAAADFPSGTQTPTGWPSLADGVTESGLQTQLADAETALDREFAELSAASPH